MAEVTRIKSALGIEFMDMVRSMTPAEREMLCVEGKVIKDSHAARRQDACKDNTAVPSFGYPVGSHVENQQSSLAPAQHFQQQQAA